MDWLTQLLTNANTPGYVQPVMGPTPEWPSPDQSLGAALQPAGATLQQSGPLTPPAPQEASQQGSGFQQQFLKGLSGVKAPAAPDVVKPSTPAAPQTRPIESGALFQLLNQISAARPQMRPTTLGGALGIGRY